MKNYRSQTPPTLTEYLYNVGHTAAYIALRARGQYSEFIRNLNMNQYADRITEQAADYMTTATEYRAQHATHRAHADTLREEADRLYTLADSYTATPTDRTAYLQRADELSTAAEQESRYATDARETAEDTEQEHSARTYTDREDVTHEAICAYLAAMDGEDWSDQDARDRAFLTAIKAAGTYASRLAAAKGAAQNKTYVINMTEDERQRATKQGETITDEEAAQRAAAKRADIIRRYGNLDVKIPFSTRGAMLDGWTTYEHRNTPKYKGWYMVQHYKRIAPAPIDETAQNVAIRKDIFDNYDIRELISIGKFSEREACVLSLLAEINSEAPASDEAQAVAEAGQEAVNAYRAECDARQRACTVQESRKQIDRQFKRNADRVRRAAEIRRAFILCGCSDNESTLRVTTRNLRVKVDDAIKHAQREAPVTVYHGAIPEPTATPRITAQTAKPTEYATMAIQWIEDYPTPTAYVDMRKHARDIVNAHTITPPTMTAAAYVLVWRMLEHVTQTRAELPREERRADVLSRKAREAQEAAREAREAANRYSPKDTSAEAREARIKAQEAAQHAAERDRRAAEQAHEVERMQAFIAANIYRRRA
jgi:hypothetical protein